MAESGGHTAAEIKLTKCVAIQTRTTRVQDPSEPKWMKYMQCISPQSQGLSVCEKSDWKSADNGHVLLHIDIPSEHVYPLPLLITPAPCVYLVAFDLPEGKEEEEKVLKRIRDTLKDVYTYSYCGELRPDGLSADVNVFLVGLQREEKDRSSFAQQLREMLETRSYERMIVFTGAHDPYWVISDPGAEFSLHDNSSLLSSIQSFSYQPSEPIYQLLACQYVLHQMFEGHPFVLYEEVKAKLANVVPNLEQFLKVLHCFGFIFYRSLPDLDKSAENLVVLQPQYLRQLFEEVQKLSKRPGFTTIEELFNRTSTVTHDQKKWFQAMCTSMGLVIERCIGGKPEYVFVMGLEPECNPPEHAHYSIDPLLVTYTPSGYEEMQNDYLLPSPLFPAFVSTFLKKLNEQYKKPFPKAIAMKRHYLHVSVPGSKSEGRAAAQIHVVERDSYIEIGLQQFHVGTKGPPLTQDQLLDKLQRSCQDVCTVVSKSAECATERLKLETSSLKYGFLCQFQEVDSFGEFNPDDGTLTCCDVPQDSTPQQQIWYDNIDVANEEVVVRPVQIPGPAPGRTATIRKLETAASCTTDGPDQTSPPSPAPMKSKSPGTSLPRRRSPSSVPDVATPQPQALEDGATAERVLHHLRERFIAEVDALALVSKLANNGIISIGELKMINTATRSVGNQTLHDSLKKRRSKEVLMTVCRIISGVEDHPEMRKFGEEMQSMLEGAKQHAVGHLTGQPEPQPSVSEIQSNPSPPPSGTYGAYGRPRQLENCSTPEQVLHSLRRSFIITMDADAIVRDLVYEGIIGDGDLATITNTADPRQKNQILHARLVKTCTKDALTMVCSFIIDVQGNPKMKAFGREMQNMLEAMPHSPHRLYQ